MIEFVSLSSTLTFAIVNFDDLGQIHRYCCPQVLFASNLQATMPEVGRSFSLPVSIPAHANDVINDLSTAGVPATAMVGISLLTIPQNYSYINLFFR